MSVPLASPEASALMNTLARIVNAVDIVAPDRFIWAGQVVALQAGVPPSLYPTSHPLITLLRDHLYQHAYVRPLGSEAAQTSLEPIPQFVEMLSRANTSRELWHEGWRIAKVLSGGQVLAEKHQMSRILWPGEFVSRDGSAMALRPQALLGVFQPRESIHLQAGFYFAYGEAVADEQDEGHQLRFYWNVTAVGAVQLLANVTRLLNRFGVPFRFKCLNAAEHFMRLDAAVLYVNRRFFRMILLLLNDMQDGLGQHLGQSTPLFTKQLMPGVALAEDPVGGESFGMNRCRILAEGLWNAYCERLTGAADRLHRVVAQFEGHGLSLQRPYLNPASTFTED